MRKVSSKFEGSSMSFGGVVAGTIGIGTLLAMGSDAGHYLSGKVSNAIDAIKANDEAMEQLKKQSKTSEK